jgi:hypothetical protein
VGGTGYYRRVAGAWVQLGLLGGAAGVSPGNATFNGRAGVVVPAANDYTFAQLASRPTTLAGYGISDAVGATDARLSDARAPLAHTHQAAQLSDATAVGRALLTAADAAAQRAALALGGAALLAVGTATGTVAAGDDARLTNPRTPTTHASSHTSGGGDPLTLAESQVTNLVTDLAGKAATVHVHSAADVTTGQLVPARGGTGADLSAAVAGSWPMVAAAGVMRAMPPVARATDLAMAASSTGVSLGCRGPTPRPRSGSPSIASGSPRPPARRA